MITRSWSSCKNPFNVIDHYKTIYNGFPILSNSDAALTTTASAESAEEPVLVVFQPKRRVCGKCGARITRASKTGLCKGCSNRKKAQKKHESA
ncbi:hypothetical protein KAU55_00700 [Candidatus Bathyarchaeota archaeon]|nr:hypothetical protein [Candidatus Bathyarchaeota archaeon]